MPRTSDHDELDGADHVPQRSRCGSREGIGPDQEVQLALWPWMFLTFSIVVIE
jgi:hypothetical protein